MRVGAIDLGTQTFRLAIADVSSVDLKVLKHFRENVRLGEGLRTTGMLQSGSIERGIEALKKFRQALRDLKVEKVQACGTHALRQAGNADEFLRAARHLGYNVRILSGGEEAAVSLEGVKATLPDLHYPVVVMDIGGGSSEFVLADEERILYSQSLKMGAVSLTERFISSLPPEDSELDALKGYVASGLTSLKSESSLLFNTVVAVGGTATTLAAIHLEMTDYDPLRVRGLKLKLDQLKGLLSRLKGLTKEELGKVKGLEPERADIILAGTVLTVEVLEVLKAREVTISDGGLLLGLLTIMKRSCFPC